MSFVPEISSYCIDMIKLTGSASSEVLACVVLLCARSDTHALLAPNYKEQQQLMISLKFWISLGFRWPKSQSMLPVFSSAASVDCSARSYLFSFAIAQLAVHKNCFKMWQKKPLKPKKNKTKQNKTKRKKKHNFLESKDHWSIKLWSESDRRCKNNFQESLSGVVCFHLDRFK